MKQPPAPPERPTPNRQEPPSSEARQAAARLSRELLRAASGQAQATAEQTKVAEQARALARALTRLEAAELRQGILDALEEQDSPAALDAVWEVWRAERHQELSWFLADRGQPAVYPPELAILSRLHLGQEAELRAAGPEAVEPLLEAGADPDPAIQRRALAALQRLEAPASREEVCRWVIEHDHPLARQAALAAGFAPSDPQRRALFYLLTEQWERYEALDFDASLLRAVYQTAEPGLRQKIAGLARRTGWGGFVDAILRPEPSGRLARRLEELSEVEWDVALVLLSRQRRWDEMWRLAQNAPAWWSARLLRALDEADWQPEKDEERESFSRLAAAAEAAEQAGPPRRRLARAQLPLQEHTRLVTALVFPHQGEAQPAGPHFNPRPGLLCSASADRTVRIWELPGGHNRRTLEGHASFVVSLAASPDGRILASGSADHTVRLWSLPEGEPLATLGGHAGEVHSLAFSPDGEWLASGDDLTIRLWRLPEGRLAHILRGHTAAVLALAFSPDGERLVSGDREETVHWWSFPPQTEESRPTGTLMDRAAAWALSAEGTELASSTSYGRVRLWRLPEGELVQTLEGKTDGQFAALAPLGGLLAASDRQDVRLWRIPGTAPLRTLEGHARPVQALAFSPDGRSLASGSADRTVRLWDLPGGTPALASPELPGPVRGLAFSPDGGWLAAQSELDIPLWSLEDIGHLFLTAGAQLSPEALDWAEANVKDDSLPEADRRWLRLALDLVRWQRRFDIGIGEAPPLIALGEFDIELG